MPDKSEDTQIIRVPAPPVQDISGKGREQSKAQPQPQPRSQAQDIQLKTANDFPMTAVFNPVEMSTRKKGTFQCSSISLEPRNKQQQDSVDALLSLHDNKAVYVLFGRDADGLACIFFYTGIYKPQI